MPASHPHRFRKRLNDAFAAAPSSDEVVTAVCRVVADELAGSSASYVKKLDDYDALGPALLEAIARGETLAIADVARDPRVSPAVVAKLVEHGVSSLLMVPVRGPGDPGGALAVQRDVPGEWSDHEIALVSEAAERTWYAVDHGARAGGSAARDRYRLKLTDALHAQADEVKIRDAAAWLFGEHITANRVLWTRVEGDFVVIEPEYCNWLPSLAGRIPRAIYGERQLATLRSGGVVVLEDVERQLPPLDAAPLRAVGVMASIAVGLVRDGEWVATFSAHSTAPRKWTHDEIQLMIETADRAWSEVDRARAEAALKEASRRKDEFIAMLAHELRNPLAPLRTVGELLRLSQSPEIVEDARQIVEGQVTHMTRLVDDLLDAARITRGTFRLQRASASLAETVRAAVDMHRTGLAEGGIVLELDVPDVTLELDATRIVQVMSNLVHNAVKFTPHGGRIRITGRVADGRATLQVSDTGTGIPAAELPHVFELFRQGDTSANRRHGGLGVGLALARTIVELHGGTIAARSVEGRGTTIELTLPAATPAATKPAPAPAATSRRVLIVDDNKDAARALARIAKVIGVAATLAHDGETAVTLAREVRPDVVLLDIGMPGMDGYETCRQLRGEHPDAVIVAVTGWGGPEDRQRAMQAGFDAHVTKPADPTLLRQLMGTSMGGGGGRT